MMKMRRWYRLSIDDENLSDSPLFLSVSEFGQVDAMDLTAGRAISNWPKTACLSSSSPDDDGEAADLLVEESLLPVFSERVCKAMVDAGIGIDEVEFLPVVVKRSTGEKVGNFGIMNVLKTRQCINRPKCLLLKEEGDLDQLTDAPRIRAIGRIAIDQGALASLDVVRPLEFKNAVLVSERFREVFQKSGFKGAGFSEVIYS